MSFRCTVAFICLAIMFNTVYEKNRTFQLCYSQHTCMLYVSYMINIDQQFLDAAFICWAIMFNTVYEKVSSVHSRFRAHRMIFQRSRSRVQSEVSYELLCSLDKNFPKIARLSNNALLPM